MPTNNKAYSLWRVGGCQQGFRSVASFAHGGTGKCFETATSHMQTVSCKLKKMTAKDKQIEFIKTYSKPKLKEEGFRTSGQTWWKIKDDFFVVINLQNSQRNSKEELSFCR